MSGKPHVTTRGPAAQYAGPTEQIIEYSVPDGDATGGLISIRWNPDTGAVSVHAYRHDSAVTVTASAADGAGQLTLGTPWIVLVYTEEGSMSPYGTFPDHDTAWRWAEDVRASDGITAALAMEVQPIHPATGPAAEEAPASGHAALDAIAEMLRDPDWGAGMLEDIADIVRGTGRTVEDYPDGRQTWTRH